MVGELLWQKWSKMAFFWVLFGAVAGWWPSTASKIVPMVCTSKLGHRQGPHEFLRSRMKNSSCPDLVFEGSKTPTKSILAKTAKLFPPVDFDISLLHTSSQWPIEVVCKVSAARSVRAPRSRFRFKDTSIIFFVHFFVVGLFQNRNVPKSSTKNSRVFGPPGENLNFFSNCHSKFEWMATKNRPQRVQTSDRSKVLIVADVPVVTRTRNSSTGSLGRSWEWLFVQCSKQHRFLKMRIESSVAFGQSKCARTVMGELQRSLIGRPLVPSSTRSSSCLQRASWSQRGWKECRRSSSRIRIIQAPIALWFFFFSPSFFEKKKKKKNLLFKSEMWRGLFFLNSNHTFVLSFDFHSTLKKKYKFKI